MRLGHCPKVPRRNLWAAGDDGFCLNICNVLPSEMSNKAEGRAFSPETTVRNEAS